jgi:hypothetical protein
MNSKKRSLKMRKTKTTQLTTATGRKIRSRIRKIKTSFTSITAFATSLYPILARS